ncbi:UBX domain-containing protein 8 [Chanos chanos]|uniref:UBX domain-containing protein 8 n=1 Tax=Chanos chanos TaxID=29144 RepID=A0A6J2UYD5_CHACN|nr:UBX domain-containing protein 8 [Chanos chanos]
MAAFKSAVLCTVLALIFCFTSWKFSILGIKGALLLAGRGLFFLGLLTWLGTSLYPRLKSFLRTNIPAPTECQRDNEEEKLKQELAWREQQERHNAKSSSYQELVLRPRQEALLRQKEERFYRMTGETWKLSPGYSVGEGETELHIQEDTNETPNQRAIKRRKLPVRTSRAPEPVHICPEKRVIVLPDEPSDDTEGVVKVALRCPSGRTVYRRFLKSHSSFVLLDFLLKTGYHPTIYTLCTSYPRRPLLTGAELSLEDVGIVRDTVLNIEEKDPSTT